MGGGNNTYWVRLHSAANNQQLELSQTVTLPLGTYTLSAAYLKADSGGEGYIFANSTTQAGTSSNNWITVSLNFTSDGSSTTKLGCRAVHTNNYTKIYAFDNFVLQWNLTQSLASLISSATEVYNEDTSNTTLKSAIDEAETHTSSTDADELESAYNTLATAASLSLKWKAWKTAKDAAEAAIANAEYANVTGAEKTELETEIAKDEPTTADGYDDAKTALEEATSTFTAAKTNYDALVAVNALVTSAGTLKYADSDKKPSASVTATSASDADTKTASQYTALRAYYESHAAAESVDVAVDYSAKLTNVKNPANTTGWTINNTTGDSKMRTNSGEPYTNSDGTTASSYFDSNSWGTAFTTTFTQDANLPVGKYLLTVKARGNGTTTYQVTAGEESTDISAIGSAGGVFGRGWNDYSVEFEVAAAGTVTVGMNIVTGSSANWLSFGDFRLVKLDATLADAADYAALNAAISAAEAKIGFEDGEYAPYNNVALMSALSAAKAIDQDVNNVQSDVQDATNAITADKWEANIGEVNAFYDGDFAIQEEHTTAPTALAGWNNPQGIRQLIKNTESYIGLNSASSNAAVFAWGNTTMTYGNVEGYTMPLAAHTIYELSFKTCGWSDGDMGYVNVTVLNDKNEGMAQQTSATATKRIGEENPWNEFRIVFATGDAGNYKFGMWTSKHTVFTDLVLKKAASQVLEFADNEAMPKYAPGTYPSVKITRTLAAGKWATAVYPFAVSGVNDIAVLNSYDKGTGTLGFTTAAASTANVPFLMRSTAGTTEISLSNVEVAAANATDAIADEASLKGTYETTAITNEAKNYVLSSNTIYSVGTAGATIAPYRAYIQIAQDGEAKALRFVIDGEDATGIESIAAEAENTLDGQVYDMSGRLVKNPVKGMYIVNGKKVLVK